MVAKNVIITFFRAVKLKTYQRADSTNSLKITRNE